MWLKLNYVNVHIKVKANEQCRTLICCCSVIKISKLTLGRYTQTYGPPFYKPQTKQRTSKVKVEES